MCVCVWPNRFEHEGEVATCCIPCNLLHKRIHLPSHNFLNPSLLMSRKGRVGWKHTMHMNEQSLSSCSGATQTLVVQDSKRMRGIAKTVRNLSVQPPCTRVSFWWLKRTTHCGPDGVYSTTHLASTNVFENRQQT